MSAADREEALAFLRGDILVAALKSRLPRRWAASARRRRFSSATSPSISRKLDEPLSVLFCARSGAGKSTLQDRLCDLVPPEDLVKYTRISGQVLFYKDENALATSSSPSTRRTAPPQAAYALRSLLSSGYLSCSVTRTDPQTGRQVADDRTGRWPRRRSSSPRPTPRRSTTRPATASSSSPSTSRESRRGGSWSCSGGARRWRGSLARRGVQGRLRSGTTTPSGFSSRSRSSSRSQLTVSRSYLILRREQKKYLAAHQGDRAPSPAPAAEKDDAGPVDGTARPGIHRGDRGRRRHRAGPGAVDPGAQPRRAGAPDAVAAAGDREARRREEQGGCRPRLRRRQRRHGHLRLPPARRTRCA